MKVIHIDVGCSSKVINKLNIDKLNLINAMGIVTKDYGKLLCVRSKHKKKQFYELIYDIYRKNKEKYDTKLFSLFDNLDIIQGSYIGGLEALILSHGEKWNDNDKNHE